MAKHTHTLTAARIAALKGGASRREVPDGAVGGLYLVIQPSGAKSWCYRYRLGKAAKLTFGAHPALDLRAARLLASEAALALARGMDPAIARRARNLAAEPPRDVFETVVAEYLERHARRHLRERSWREAERLLTRETAAWRGRRLSELTRADVGRLLDPIADRGAPIIANRLLSTLRRLGAWATERGLISGNPFQGVRPPSKETSRERVLTDLELRAAWRAFDAGGVIGDAAKVLLLTGARLREVTAMAWSEVDLGARVWTLPAGRAKNGAAHQVPLADSVLRILAERRAACPAGRFVFSATGGRTPVVGVSRAKRRFDAAMAAELGGELAPWVTHDLRRTAATNLAALGVLPHIIETVLNHKGGVIRGVAAVYNRHPYMVERRAALDAWAVALAAIVADAEPLLALAA